ncbi:hypothetical protein TI03_07260, partial [Achromatium sp. WMS1]
VHRETNTFLHFSKQLNRQFTPLAMQKGINFYIDMQPKLPEALHVDWGKITQVIRNLLGNAIKFTEQGSVTLRISLEKSNKTIPNTIAVNVTKQWLVLQVKDTGIGIEKSKQEQIFEAFQQVDGSISRKYGGTGLGLAISRRYAKLLGGELIVESAPNVGTSFNLFIPLDALAIVDHLKDATDNSNNDSVTFYDSYFRTRSIKCLAVDDDSNNIYA